MRYEGVSFNKELVRGMTLPAFVQHKSFQHLWPEITPELRTARLTELHFLCAL